jgi:hypothetical protein
MPVIADTNYTNASPAAAREGAEIVLAAPAPRRTNTRGDYYSADLFIHAAPTALLGRLAVTRLAKTFPQGL